MLFQRGNVVALRLLKDLHVENHRKGMDSVRGSSLGQISCRSGGGLLPNHTRLQRPVPDGPQRVFLWTAATIHRCLDYYNYRFYIVFLSLSTISCVIFVLFLVVCSPPSQSHELHSIPSFCFQETSFWNTTSSGNMFCVVYVYLCLLLCDTSSIASSARPCLLNHSHFLWHFQCSISMPFLPSKQNHAYIM